jgi:hypothetical protein
MSRRDFALHPFPWEQPGPVVELTGSLARRDSSLTICYRLRGDLAALSLPLPVEPPSRRDGLWEDTCFEFFLGQPQDPAYWEFNLSPSGNWQVYRFTGYRQGRVEETAFTSLPFGVRRGGRTLEVALEVDLGALLPPGHPLEVAVAAVLKLREGETTYWALTHRGPTPDFHRRDSFIICC